MAEQALICALHGFDQGDAKSYSGSGFPSGVARKLIVFWGGLVIPGILNKYW